MTCLESISMKGKMKKVLRSRVKQLCFLQRLRKKKKQNKTKQKNGRDKDWLG